MAFINLYDFNGSVNRNRNQDAVFESLNDRSRFLQDLEEKRKSRLQEARQRSSAIIVQRNWKKYRALLAARQLVRNDFDASSSLSDTKTISFQIARLGLIYRPACDGDNKRMTHICSQALQIHKDNPNFSLELNKFSRIKFYGRVLEMICHFSKDDNVTIPMRFLETFVHPGDLAELVEKNYFQAFLNIICNSIPVNNVDINQPNVVPHRVKVFCEQLLRPILLDVISSKNRLYKLFHSIFSHSNDFIMCTVVLPEVLRTVGSKIPVNTTVESLYIASKSRHSETSKMYSSLLAFTLFSMIDDVLQADDETLQRHLHLISQSSADIAAIPTDNNTGKYIHESIANVQNGSKFTHLFKRAVNSGSAGIEFILAFKADLEKNGYFSFLLNSQDFIYRLFQFTSSLGSSVNPPVSSYYETLKGGWNISDSAKEVLIPALNLLCSLVSDTMQTSLDDDLKPGGKKNHLVPDIVNVTRELLMGCLGLIDLAFPEDFWATRAQADQKKKESTEWSKIYEQIVKTLQCVYRKDIRLRFLPQNFWISHNRQVVLNRTSWKPKRISGRGRHQVARPFAFVRYLHENKATDHKGSGSDSEGEQQESENPPSSADLRNLSIIKSIPFIVPFNQRLEIFQELLQHDKSLIGVDVNDYGFVERGRSQISLTVRRQHLYEDAFETLSKGKVPILRYPLRVSMVNWAGLDEIGQDGGGIFREFLGELLKTGFDQNRGLFTMTHDRLLYPNPNSVDLYQDNYSQHYYFLGRMVAKLIYEGMMMDMRFADFFLIQLLGNELVNIDLEQMKSYDPTIYKHLRSLLSCSQQELDQLCLDFSVVVEAFGLEKIVDLKENGRNIVVTLENRMEYAQLYTNFYLCKRFETIIDAMRAGVNDVIDISWLAMFDPSELQMIVSGVDADIDITDLEHNCLVYHAKSKDDEEYIKMFWNVVRNFSKEDKAAFLKFVTGCSRPPIDGFRFLIPKMGIQLSAESDLLPTSATCMNLFKLPKYKTLSTLEEKLRYAINAGAGFELQ